AGEVQLRGRLGAPGGPEPVLAGAAAGAVEPGAIDGQGPPAADEVVVAEPLPQEVLEGVVQEEADEVAAAAEGLDEPLIGVAQPPRGGDGAEPAAGVGEPPGEGGGGREELGEPDERQREVAPRLRGVAAGRAARQQRQRTGNP